MLPLLKSTFDASPDSDLRIFDVLSPAIDIVPLAHSFSSLDIWNSDFGDETNPLRFRYPCGYSKITTVLFSKKLQGELDHEGSRILVTDVHPGVVATAELVKVVGSDNEEYSACVTVYEGGVDGRVVPGASGA